MSKKKTESLFDFDTMLDDVFGGLFKTTEVKTVSRVVSTSPEPTGMMKSYRTREWVGELDLEIDLPGVSPATVSLEVQLNKVIVKGSKDGKNFTNTYTLSNEYVLDTAKAWLSNGQLIVKVQKNPTSEPRKIPIQVV